MNRDFYQNARKRCMPMGTNIVTDADIILMQEEEIERYRDRIRCLEERCKDKIRYFEEKLREKDNGKVVRIGDVITVDCDGDRIKFKTMRCIVHTDSWENGNVELCGVTKIGDLSE